MRFGSTQLESNLIEAAINYKQGCVNEGFANEYGGLEKLKQVFFNSIDGFQKDVNKLSNDYKSYLKIENNDIFAVEMSDGGWSIADGMGTNHTLKDEMELAGWHLPVRFKTSEKAVAAINSAPHKMFDIKIDSAWTEHAILSGATYEPIYEM